MSTSAEQFLHVTDLLAAPFLLVSTDGVVLAANQATEAALGLIPSELVGRQLAEVVVDAPDKLSSYLRICSRSRQLLPGSFTIAGKDEQPIACRCGGAVFEPSVNGAPASILLRLTAREVAIDRFHVLNAKIEELNVEIGKRKRVEAALREADRQKDVFLATLAHELRNPLAPIRSGLDVLARDAGSHPKILQLMQAQVTHVVRLVDDLMDVSRIMREKIELRREPVQLASLIQQSVETVRSSFEDQRQAFSVSMAENCIWVNADPVRMVQVIENLLNNASKYTDAGGRIELIAERRDAMASITVRDTGVGIESDLLPNIFGLFTQSERSLDRAQGGLGIGLTIVKRLVELHGGTVSVQSEGLGRGSTFVIQIPIVEPVEPPEKVTEPLPPVVRRRVVVVDDNEGAAWMLSMLLKKLGDHEVSTAHDGPSALEKIKSTSPEIILLDIGLPGMDGYAVAKNLRKLPEFDDVLLIALTGYGQEEDRRKSKEAGFDEHLIKPPSVDQMNAVLAHPKLSKVVR